MASHDTGKGKFPGSDWAPRYKGQDTPPEAGDQLIDVYKLGYVDPTEDVAKEAAALQIYLPLRTTHLEERIRKQAQGEKWAIQPLLDVVGLRFDRPVHVKGSRLRHLIQTNIWWAVFHYKVQASRSRPWSQTSINLYPIFQRPDRLYPGHPSYPSGHATMAYTWALLLAKFHASKAPALLLAATEVAVNREVAGVHFPSDKVCGLALGSEIAKQIYGKLTQEQKGILSGKV